MSKRRVVPYYFLLPAVGARPECVAPPESYVCAVKSLFRASRRRLQKSFNSFVRSFRYIYIYHGHKNASATNLSSRVKYAVRLATARLAHVHDFLSTQANLEIEGGFQR